MTDFAPIILNIHRIAVTLSGILFFIRAIAALKGNAWPYLRGVKMTSYLIDTTLLGAAIYLWINLPDGALENGWLYVKLVLVVSYILSGIIAMRKTNHKPMRIVFIALAAICYVNVIGIAISRNPLGWLSLI